MFLRKKIFLLILGIAFTLQFSWINIQEVSAWGGTTHQQLPGIAASYLENVVGDLGEFGERWPQLFQIYESELKLGAVYPDRVLRDSSNHVYHIRDPVPQFVNTPTVVELRYNQFKAHLLAGNYSGAVWQAGILSHYIVDLCQPMHTAGGGKEHDQFGPGGVDPHSKYEQEINAKLSEVEFGNHTPTELVISLEETVIDCAQYSYQFYDDLVETYWNGSFWTPWVKTITTQVLNRGVQNLANILYTAIKEVNITLPDFTPFAINVEVDFPNQIFQGTSYTGIINVTDWQGNPLDVNIHMTRTRANYYLADNETVTEEFIPQGPFIVLYSHEGTGLYSFEINLSVTGSVFIEIEVTKPNMITKLEIIEIEVLAQSTDTTALSSQTSIQSSQSNKTSPSFSFITLLLAGSMLILLLKLKSRKNDKIKF